VTLAIGIWLSLILASTVALVALAGAGVRRLQDGDGERVRPWLAVAGSAAVAYGVLLVVAFTW